MAAPAWGKSWGKAWGNAWGKIVEDTIEEIVSSTGSAGGKNSFRPTSLRLRNKEPLNYEEEYEVLAVITAFLRINSWHR